MFVSATTDITIGECICRLLNSNNVKIEKATFKIAAKLLYKHQLEITQELLSSCVEYFSKKQQDESVDGVLTMFCHMLTEYDNFPSFEFKSYMKLITTLHNLTKHESEKTCKAA